MKFKGNVISSIEEEKSQLRLMEGKAIAYYAAMVAAWLQNRMELDKALLALSAGGIGLLVTISTTAGLTGFVAVLSFTISVFSFLITILLLLIIFKINSEHIESIINKEKTKTPSLKRLDKYTRIFFSIGILFAVLMATATVKDDYNNKERKIMSAEEKKQDLSKYLKKTASVQGAENLDPKPILKESVQGIEDIKPVPVKLKKSLADAENLAPAPPKQGSQDTTPEPAPAEPATQQESPPKPNPTDDKE